MSKDRASLLSPVLMQISVQPCIISSDLRQPPLSCNQVRCSVVKTTDHIMVNGKIKT